MRQVALAEVKDDLSPAGVLIGFESEDDWVDYRLEHHPTFLRKVAEARDAFRAGHGVRLEDLPS
jgi:hypothetical protein